MDETQTPNTRAAGIGVDSNAIAFRPSTWEQLVNFANMIAKTSFVPKDMHGDGGAVLAAIQYGHEVNLPPMAALQSICVINGRPSVFGDGYWAIVQAHPLCELVSELPPHEALEKGYGEATVVRRGNPTPFTRRYTLDMAKTFGLLDKDNWKKMPGIMLMWRARHLAGSAAIPEATKGLIPAAIARDIDVDPGDVRHEEPAKPIQIPQPKADAKPVEAEKKKGGRKPKGDEHEASNNNPENRGGDEGRGGIPVKPAEPDRSPGPDGGTNASQSDQGEEAQTQEASWQDESLPWDRRLELWIAQATDEQFEHRTDKDSFWRINFGQVKNMDRAVELCGLIDKRNRA